MVADIALAASARTWPDRLHRFLLDHGGGRVSDRLMTAEQAAASVFDVLLIDDVCSFLTPHLVTTIKRAGSEVIGVYVPEDGSDAKRRLLECGISDVIESEATPEEFLQKINLAFAHRSVSSQDDDIARRPLGIGVTGPTPGVGMTEVAIALSRAMSDMVGTVLIDLDPTWPSVAQRLDLPVHPNIRTAVDHALHHPERVTTALHQVGRLGVLGGRADGGRGAPIGRHEILSVLAALRSDADVVIADLGPLTDVHDGLVREFDTIIAVGSATPIGVTRLMKAIDGLADARRGQSVLAIVNLPIKSGFRKAETLDELKRAFPGLTVVALPFDPRLGDAAWDGSTRSGRSYRRAVDSIADVVAANLP
jgi:MinD-like ATPase involved in chromosome partitioning or flagellar assembly